MKRDWDLLRKQLTDLEEENDVLAVIKGLASLALKQITRGAM
jgi:hypothetical protein